jgi:hypothetical protein
MKAWVRGERSWCRHCRCFTETTNLEEGGTVRQFCDDHGGDKSIPSPPPANRGER